MIQFPPKNERGMFEAHYVDPINGHRFVVELNDQDITRVQVLTEDLRQWFVGRRAKSTVALAAMALLAEHLTAAHLEREQERAKDQHQRTLRPV